MSGWVKLVVNDAYQLLNGSFFLSSIPCFSLPFFYPSLFTDFRHSFSLLLCPSLVLFSLPSLPLFLHHLLSSSFLPAFHLPFSPFLFSHFFFLFFHLPHPFSLLGQPLKQELVIRGGRNGLPFCQETSIELQRCKDQSPRPLELSCMSAVPTRLSAGTSDTSLALNS